MLFFFEKLFYSPDFKYFSGSTLSEKYGLTELVGGVNGGSVTGTFLSKPPHSGLTSIKGSLKSLWVS